VLIEPCAPIALRPPALWHIGHQMGIYRLASADRNADGFTTSERLLSRLAILHSFHHEMLAVQGRGIPGEHIHYANPADRRAGRLAGKA